MHPQRSTKTCPTCKETKEIDAFGIARARYDGRQGECRACRSARNAVFRAENVEKERARHAAYNEQNREVLRERGRLYSARQRETYPERQKEALQRWYKSKGRAYHQQWKKAHPDQCIESANRYRARLLGAYHEPVDRTAIIDRDGGICYLCGNTPTGWQLTLDHVIPLVRGGSHTPDNLRVACRSCNARKKQRLLSEL